MTENNKTPAIRFKGFTGDWEQRELGKLAEFNPKAEIPDVFEYVDLESVVGTNMISHRTENKLTAPSRAQRLAKQGDVFYQTVRPYQKNNYLFNLPLNNYVFSTGYAQMRPNINQSFLMSLLQNDSFVKVVLDNCTGTSYPAINSNDLAKIEIRIPANITEQQQIGQYFHNLDNLITLHQRKCDKLQNVKKSMLEKMFPKNGENVPEIRFKGFTGDWEQREVGDALLDIADGPFGSNLKTVHYTYESEARIVQLSNLSDYGWQEENVRYTTFKHAKEIKRCIINENELVMGKMMPAGMTIIRPNDDKMYILSSDCVRIKLNPEIATNDFFLYTTKSDEFLNQVNTDSQGSTRVRTSISKIRNMDFYVPTLAEQQQIGSYFKNLDNLITLHQRKLEKLKNIKKSCLEKMFV